MFGLRNMLNIKGDVGCWKCVYRYCGAKCCVPAKVTLGDIKRIVDTIGLKPDDFVSLEGNSGLFELKGKKGKCFFLNDDFKCELHSKGMVPLSCQMFPFLFESVEYGDDIILTLSTAVDCPGYGLGEELGEDFFEDLEKLGARLIDEIKQCQKFSKQGFSLSESLEKV